MSEEIEKFDPSTLMEGVKNRIKSTFVSLIPDDKWGEMCETEMKKFFVPRPALDYSGRRTGGMLPSEFEEICMGFLREHLREQLKKIFEDPKYSIYTIWNNDVGNGYSFSEHVDKMIKDKMPDMLEQMVKSQMGSALSILFQNLKNNNNF